MIAEAESEKADNFESQQEETNQRKKENMAYVTDIGNLMTSQDIMKKALQVLTNYYDMLERKLAKDTAAFLQHQQSPPDTWDKGFTGQSKKGNAALDMLNFILDETEKEQKQA